MSFACLRVSLTLARGPMLDPLGQTFSLYFSGMLLNDALKFSGSVSERGEAFRDFDATREEFRELGRAAEAAGLPARLPQVEAVVDTSDSAAWVLLHVANEREARTLSLGLMSSGFKGTDASALHRFFAVLLQTAKVRDDSIVADLEGR